MQGFQMRVHVQSNNAVTEPGPDRRKACKPVCREQLTLSRLHDLDAFPHFHVTCPSTPTIPKLLRASTTRYEYRLLERLLYPQICDCLPVVMEGSSRPPESSIPQCCCGRTDCPFLAHTGTLLEGLERDVQTAARLGQVCPTPSALSLFVFQRTFFQSPDKFLKRYIGFHKSYLHR